MQWRAGDPPNSITNVIRHQQRALLVDRDADGPSHRVSVLPDEASQYIDRFSTRLPVLERDEDHLVAAVGLAIPGPMLPHEHPAHEARWHRSRPRPGETKRRSV